MSLKVFHTLMSSNSLFFFIVVLYPIVCVYHLSSFKFLAIKNKAAGNIFERVFHKINNYFEGGDI